MIYKVKTEKYKIKIKNLPFGLDWNEVEDDDNDALKK